MTKTKFTVACNWDPALIEGLKQYSSLIKYIYAKTRTDIFSGGRADCEVNDRNIERGKAEKYIKKAKKAGIIFNYLLNGTVIPDEFSKETTKRIRENLDWISSSGAEWVTVTNPRLANIIRKNYPGLKINVSVFAHVKNINEINRWKMVGADSICLDRSLIHDFEKLRAMSNLTNIDLVLLANDPCLLNCEMELYHDYVMSMASVSGDKYYHYCSFSCMKRFLENPEEIIKGTFVRPEDVKLYENLGVHYFKIVDRNRTTKFILNALKSYVERKYSGNLLDLMSLFSYFDRKLTKPVLLRKENLTVESIDQFWLNMLSMLKLNIDNKKMDGYIELKIKADRESGCDQCQICLDHSDLVTLDEEAAEIVKQNINLILNVLDGDGIN